MKGNEQSYILSLNNLNKLRLETNERFKDYDSYHHAKTNTRIVENRGKAGLQSAYNVESYSQPQASPSTRYQSSPAAALFALKSTFFIQPRETGLVFDCDCLKLTKT